MPFHIDRMHTSIDIRPPAREADARPVSVAMSPDDPQVRAALRAIVLSILEEELDRYVRNRGL